MHVDVKVMVWQRIHLNDHEPVDNERIIRLLSEGDINDLFEFDELSPYLETLNETEMMLTPELNGGNPTIQLFDDNNKIIWDNRVK